ncbi:MAG: B12-binding domain-containing radical SAM protein [Bacillota bacterium]
MRILLIRPKRREQAITLGEFMFSEPLGLECIYSVLKENHEVRIIDLMVKTHDLAQLCQEWRPHVVGITSLCIDVFAVRETALEVKKIDSSIITMVGGTQAFFNPSAFFGYGIDYVFKYTTRENLSRLMDNLVRNRQETIDGIYSFFDNFQDAGKEGRNDCLVPDRSCTAHYRNSYSYFGYKPSALLQTSRGCSTHCSFCLRWRLEGPLELHEPLEGIIQQLKEINEPNIMVIDNDFLHDVRRLEDFINLLKKEKIQKKFICYGSVKSIINNKETIKDFSEVGLRAVLVGYESFKGDELKEYKKGTTVDDSLRAARILKELQIDCWASFILDPDWDKQDFQELRKFIYRLSPEISSLVPLTPFPNTPLYAKYQDRLLFSSEDYDQWSFSVVSIRPSKLNLRSYYGEVLKTNLYVNFFSNNAAYMIRRFGSLTLIKMLFGSLKFGIKYTGLMLKG